MDIDSPIEAFKKLRLDDEENLPKNLVVLVAKNVLPGFVGTILDAVYERLGRKAQVERANETLELLLNGGIVTSTIVLGSDPKQRYFKQRAHMDNGPNKHGASESATGYFYQCRYALFASLNEIANTPNMEISIEKFDDIAFEKNGDPVALIQTKHHIKGIGTLTDASVDLWKTLGIWAGLVAKDPETPFRTRLMLLTTGEAPTGTAASFLRARDRDVDKAHTLLLSATSTSTNATNKDSYKAFRGLPETTRKSLLNAITVLDVSANILDVREEICDQLRFAVPREKVDILVERLEGWWFTMVIRAITGAEAAIPVTAIENKIDELRESFKRDALPIDFADKTPPAAVVAALDKRPFVQQLRLISIGDRRVEFAIRDYYRASEQRSKWAREELLIDGELEVYERHLIEEWEPRFEGMRDELESDCPPTIKIDAGQKLYSWAETEADLPLRTVKERFLCHGSFHILANQCKVGWHPDYSNHIKSEPIDEK